MRTLFVAVVAFHFAIITTNMVSFFILPFITFTGPMWLYRMCITVIAMSCIANLAVAPGPYCPLTRIENALRRSLGEPEIKGFIGHYVLKKSNHIRVSAH